MDEADDEEIQASCKEMAEYVESLVGEAKDDLHRERFFATPAGMFDNMWATVLMREDLDHSVQQWRVHRLRSDAQRSPAREEPDVSSEEDDAMAENVGPAEASEPNPDGFMHNCTRLPRGHDVALAHAEIVLLDRTLSQFDAHYDEVCLASEQERSTDPQRHAATASPKACPDGLQTQRALGAEEMLTRPRRRRGAFRVDPKVLEAKVSKKV